MARPPSARRAALITIAAIAAGAAGVALNRALRSGAGTPTAVPATGVDSLYLLKLPDLSGKLQPFSQWQGRTLLVNFWATWCEPCREEVPALVRLQEKYPTKTLQIVGISVDSADKVRDFALKFKINYPLVIGGLEAIDLARALGNRAGALPFTVLLGSSGGLINTHLGGMNDQGLASFLQRHQI